MASKTVLLEHELSRSGVVKSSATPVVALDGIDVVSLSGQCGHLLVTTGDGTILFNNGINLLSAPWERCQELESKCIMDIDCSDNYHVGLNMTGDIFSWEGGDEGVSEQDLEKHTHFLSSKMLELSMKVVQVSCGKKHTVCLTEEGRIGVWGSNTEGQLGLGREAQDFYTTPQLIDCLKGVMFIQVAAGGYHTLALTGSSAVFGWGRNSSGQLGSKTRKDKQLNPAPSRDLRSERIKSISCGESHSAMLSADGRVFSFGLDFRDENDEVPHGEIYCLTEKRVHVSSIVCGSHHTVAFVADTGEAFLFRRKQQNFEVIQVLNQGETDIKILCSKGVILFTVDNSTLVHVNMSVRTDAASERMNKMLLLDRIESNDFQDKSDENIKHKLKSALSSLSCVNGSFLLSDSKHCECSRQNGHGVDMDAVTSFFNLLKNKCLDNDSVLTTVEEAWLKLSSDLPDEPCHVETLRIYLVVPLCHLVEDDPSTFFEPFVNSWMKLDNSCHKILNQWLQTLPSQYLKTYMEVFRKHVSQMLPNFKEAYTDTKTIPAVVQSCVKLMEKIYKVNEKRDEKIAWQEFYMPELFSTININEDFILSLKDLEKGLENFRFCKFPFLYNPQNKAVLLISHNKMEMINANMPVLEQISRYYEQYGLLFQGALTDPDLHLKHTTVDGKLFLSGIKENQSFIPELIVSRNNIIEETQLQITILMLDTNAHKKELRVMFDGEKAVGPGVYQEFFTLLFARLLDQDLFCVEEESNLLWFKPQNSDGLELLKFTGFMLGLAIYNGRLVNLPFPLAVYKKLLGESVTFEDFKELKPEVANSLEKYVLGEQICVELYFEETVERAGKTISINLCENGDERLVTLDNRQEYINLKVNFQLNKNIEKEFEHFSRGFFDAFDKRVLRDLKFLSIELQGAIVGQEQINLSELKQRVKYEDGYHEDDPVIFNLWEILMFMETDDRKLFIRFITGTERIPHGGLDLAIRPLEIAGENTYDLIPVVATCANILFLPRIADADRLKNRLYQAIGRKDDKDKNHFTSLNEALGRQP